MKFLNHKIESQSDPFLNKVFNSAKKVSKECIVNAVLVNTKGEALILKRSALETFKPSCWDLPGGVVHQDELPLDALHRELKEETGIEVESFDFLVAIWNWVAPGNICISQLEFLVQLNQDVGHITLEADSFDRYQWIDPSELIIVTENRDSTDTWLHDLLGHVFDHY